VNEDGENSVGGTRLREGVRWDVSCKSTPFKKLSGQRHSEKNRPDCSRLPVWIIMVLGKYVILKEGFSNLEISGSSCKTGAADAKKTGSNLQVDWCKCSPVRTGRSIIS